MLKISRGALSHMKPLKPGGTVISVNLGVPRNVEWEGESYLTGIFKSPVEGRVKVRALGLQGDSQADLNVHGGPQKAVYVYPSEHYEYWRNELQRNLTWGMFGENLTTEGLLEEDVRPGDRLRTASVEFTVTAPRFPCYKLGIKFGSMEMIKRFQASRRSGFYLSVSGEGDIAKGDSINIVESDIEKPTIAEIFASER